MSILHLPPNFEKVTLTRDITKHLKRGHRWAFANSFQEGSVRRSGLGLLYFKNEVVGCGIMQADTQLKFRLMCLADEPYFKPANLEKSLELWCKIQWENAVALRKVFDSKVTNSFRLINGEGDGFPGLIIDVYADTAVIKHDHEIMEQIWNHDVIVEWIRRDFSNVKNIYLKRKNDSKVKGKELCGHLAEEVQFLENGLLFATNIRDAAKTGFFLDQRDNRKLIQSFAKGKTVLNLFSYTGGFSLFAAKGGASHVTSVDIAKAAIQAVKRNFEINNLGDRHTDLAVDAFDFVESEIAQKRKYNLVITDPPSFAPNEKSVPQATAAYIKIFSQSIRLVEKDGYFAASSCSSHISHSDFIEICKEAFSKARKKGTVIYVGNQPSDHPFPLAMEELRYLKFILFRVD